MDIHFEQGDFRDIDELEQLYNDLIDYLNENTNYPGWVKGIYPGRQTAIDGVNDGSLYVARCGNNIIGSVILRHRPEPVYSEAKWGIEASYNDIFVVYTLVVHPDYIKHGVGKHLMNFVIQQGVESKVKAIRLDVYENNQPAIRLYEKCGFQYIGTFDMGLGNQGLNWFRLYEKIL